jgi:prepilin-type N-terminal cleavage/methylation domain-containing protein
MGYGRGYTLYEMMATLVVAGIAMSLAVPAMEGVLRRERVRGAVNRLAGDLEFTRMAALRNGATAVLRFVPDARCGGRGGTGYRVGLRGDTGVLRGSFEPDGVPVCFQSNTSDTVAFNSRGLLAPFGNRTIRGVLGTTRDSLTVSAVGRVYRRF